ncbi:protein translocase subunit SECA1, chloroplastic-like isoform X2 [Rosa rugosa]|nr:protein translocase subunit SECA1, chloroplastic-like isoform X2 [Rosa rugosa]XP_062011072.1 protein translocase subunit SECA1, chloroplastic-like isoform X2 [Rosa rugosa]
MVRLREMLMPRVVKLTEGLSEKTSAEKVLEVNEKLFPCKLSNEKTKLAEEAVNLAVETWGQRLLTELEAEERLSYSCEKGPALDEVIYTPNLNYSTQSRCFLFLLECVKICLGDLSVSHEEVRIKVVE